MFGLKIMRQSSFDRFMSDTSKLVWREKMEVSKLWNRIKDFEVMERKYKKNEIQEKSLS